MTAILAAGDTTPCSIILASLLSIPKDDEAKVDQHSSPHPTMIKHDSMMDTLHAWVLPHKQPIDLVAIWQEIIKCQPVLDKLLAWAAALPDLISPIIPSAKPSANDITAPLALQSATNHPNWWPSRPNSQCMPTSWHTAPQSMQTTFNESNYCSDHHHCYPASNLSQHYRWQINYVPHLTTYSKWPNSWQLSLLCSSQLYLPLPAPWPQHVIAKPSPTPSTCPTMRHSYPRPEPLAPALFFMATIKNLNQQMYLYQHTLLATSPVFTQNHRPPKWHTDNLLHLFSSSNHNNTLAIRNLAKLHWMTPTTQPSPQPTSNQ